jgi:hypothetical protein
MHDLDRAMFEAGFGDELEDSRESTEFEQREFQELLGEVLGEGGAGSSEMQEFEQTELALELLEVSSEQELDRFLGDLLSRAAGAVSTFAGSSTGQALKGIAKNAVGQALPVVGQAVGAWIDPRFGDYGARAGRAAGALLGLELEGLSQEDREFATARALVNWIIEAVRRATRMAGQAAPAQVAKTAAVSAAQRTAPGLAQLIGWPGPAAPSDGGPQTGPSGNGQSGSWVRRGNTVILYGL